MLEQLLAWKTLIIGFWLVLFLLLERRYPASPWRENSPERSPGQSPGQRFSQRRHLAQNASLWLVNALVSPLLTIFLTAAAVEYSPSWRGELPQVAPVFLSLVIDLLLLDLWIYSWHRANHRLPFLWRFHQVHHLDQQLDASSALRFHFGEVILSAIARMPVIFLFAIPLTSVIIFEVLVATAAVFHHANLRLPMRLERGLSRVIITPAIHWVHHHAIRVDTDSNYGTVLSCWDRWFHSMSPNSRRPDMELGVEHRVENRIFRLFVLPFRRAG